MIIEREGVKMNVYINGKEKVFENESIAISELLKSEKVEQPEMVSVQVNGEFVDKTAYGTTNIRANDEVEFLYFMGGGR